MKIHLHILELGKRESLTTPGGKISVVIFLEVSSGKKVEIRTTQGRKTYWIHEVLGFELQGGESIGALEHSFVMMLLVCTPVSEDDHPPQTASGKGEAGTTEIAEGKDEGCEVKIQESGGEKI